MARQDKAAFRGPSRSPRIPALAGFCALLLAVLVPLAAQEPGEPALGHPPDPSRVTPEAEVTPGIEVTLSLYSGRTNPRWLLEEGEEMDRILGLLRQLGPQNREAQNQELFDYGEWNRLGYPSFWVRARGLEEAPDAVHVYRDMAVVIPERGAESRQATGAGELYEALVEQAEERDFGQFFDRDNDQKGKRP